MTSNSQSLYNNYCEIAPPNHYKMTTVDDLTLKDKISTVELGYFLVIGRLSFDCTSNNYYLESLRMKSFPLQFQLDDGETSVLLVPDIISAEFSQNNGKFVECCGEVIIWSNNDNAPLEDLSILNMIDSEMNPNDSQNMRNNYPCAFQPAIVVHGMHSIEKAHDLLMCNMILNKVKDWSRRTIEISNSPPIADECR